MSLQYASGATVQIILFATLAIELKRRAPNAHTFLEVIRARYGLSHQGPQVSVTDLLTPSRPSYPFRLHLLRPVHQHPRHSHATDGWVRCGNLPDGHAYGGGLLPLALGCCLVHNVWRVSLGI